MDTFILLCTYYSMCPKIEDAKHMIIENAGPFITTVGGGFFIGALIGYALKKVAKLVAVVIGLFFAGMAYLQYHQILSVNWDKLQVTSQNLLSNLANATTQIPGLNMSDHGALTIMNLGIPLTGSMSMGFAVGFMKG
jgi:uncharacterized membrane protein (Fun14 family)